MYLYDITIHERKTDILMQLEIIWLQLHHLQKCMFSVKYSQ